MFKGRATPYLCEGFLYKPASILYVFDVEECDFVPLPVRILGLHQQNQLEFCKTFRETLRKQRPIEFNV